ncbi:efflux transporter outer membrane subunit [Solimonas sp. C16B3]|uniref:Efflux transporter outer membrane subunit n=1 Tax=Solimonas marina TaxID=2714601 RepID=A0A969W9H9_9GAMM|nr:efflux transporter outer membrane subunit [Solimonas marina]
MLAVCIALPLAACSAALHPLPDVKTPDHWQGDTAPLDTAAAAAPDWWSGFGDPVLVDLIETALRQNTDMAAAVARVDQARAQARAAAAGLWPQLNASVSAQRSRSVSAATGKPVEATAVEPLLQASYEVDLWGRLDRLDLAARASLLGSEASRDTVALTVAASVAKAYLGLRAIDARLDIARQTVATREAALKLARSQAASGYISQLDLDQSEAEYRAATQLVPQLEQARTQQQNALRLLLGELPGEVQRGAAFDALKFPAVPAVLPSQLLRRRPDVAQAEQQVAAADASWAAARDRLLPSLNLSASIGSLFEAQLPNDPVNIWSVGGSILAPIFNHGALSAQASAAQAQRVQAVEAYRKTVLTAFSEVENALAAVHDLDAQMNEAQQQRDALAAAYHHAQRRYQAGYSSYLDPLVAQRSLLTAELGLVQLRADQLNARVTLYQALGGGWRRPDER